MDKLYKIRPLRWQKNDDGTCQASSKLNAYYIRPQADGKVQIWYKDGRFKEYPSVEEAQKWANEIHYPGQVAKIMDVVG